MGSQGTSDHDLLPSVTEYISNHRMLLPGQRVVVAVSGGPDSVALLDLLCRLSGQCGLSLHVAHLNHQLRSDESDTDAEFVASMSRRLGLPYHGGSADVRALLRSERTSLEGAARLARQRFLSRVMREADAQRVALGHNQSDQAETLLLRLIRGAGRTGLCAIRPVRDDGWIRPLLNTPRSAIVDYLRLRGIPYRQDLTNRDTRFTRNRVRWDLVPHLERHYAPRIEQILARTCEVFQQEEDLLEGQTDDALLRAASYRSNTKIVLDGKTLFGYHIALQRRVFRKALQHLSASREGPDYRILQAALAHVSSRSGAAQISALVSVHRSGDSVVFSRPAPVFQGPLRVPGCTQVAALGGRFEACVRPAVETAKEIRHLGPLRAFIDAARTTGRLEVRNRRVGDRFRPLGLHGTQKISDLLIDSKVPAPLRDEVPLVVSGGEILWVVGLRTGQSAAVSDSTISVVDLTYSGGWIGSADILSRKGRRSDVRS